MLIGLVLAVLGYFQLAPDNTTRQKSANPSVAMPDSTPGAEHSTHDRAERDVESGAVEVDEARVEARRMRRTEGEYGPPRDLDADELKHGHTLSKHVGRSDAELIERLRSEPELASASTWTDKETAERCVGMALAHHDEEIAAWLRRKSDPKLAIDYSGDSHISIGRSMRRGEKVSRPCSKARIVLALEHKSGGYFVLTSYPEAR